MDVDSDPDNRIWSAVEGDYCMLTIYDVEDDDSGVYTCTATSTAGEAITTGELDCFEGKYSKSMIHYDDDIRSISWCLITQPGTLI